MASRHTWAAECLHLWRSPQGWIALVTNQGTVVPGAADYAQTLWRTAAPLAPSDPPEPTQRDYIPVA